MHFGRDVIGRACGGEAIVRFISFRSLVRRRLRGYPVTPICSTEKRARTSTAADDRKSSFMEAFAQNHTLIGAKPSGSRLDSSSVRGKRVSGVKVPIKLRPTTTVRT